MSNEMDIKVNQPKDKWIDVKDRLPDYDEFVLWLSKTCSCWVMELDKDGNDWLESMTHWMPLPEPPEIINDKQQSKTNEQ